MKKGNSMTIALRFQIFVYMIQNHTLFLIVTQTSVSKKSLKEQIFAFHTYLIV